jgi:hypothetical protein
MLRNVSRALRSDCSTGSSEALFPLVWLSNKFAVAPGSFGTLILAVRDVLQG